MTGCYREDGKCAPREDAKTGHLPTARDEKRKWLDEDCDRKAKRRIRRERQGNAWNQKHRNFKHWKLMKGGLVEPFKEKRLQWKQIKLACQAKKVRLKQNCGDMNSRSLGRKVGERSQTHNKENESV